MIRKVVKALGGLLLFTTAYTQNTITDTSSTCIAYWKKGDVKELMIRKAGSSMQNGKEKDRSASLYYATITILDSTAKGYKVQWQYKPATVQDTSAMGKLNNLFLNLKIVYATSETGGFDSLINYDE